jgi:hypothetical protein
MNAQIIGNFDTRFDCTCSYFVVDQDNNTEKENNIIQSAAFSLSIINDGKTTVTLQIGCKNGR